MVDSNYWNNPMMGSGDYINAERDKNMHLKQIVGYTCVDSLGGGNAYIYTGEEKPSISATAKYNIGCKAIEKYGFRYIGKGTKNIKNGEIRLLNVEFDGTYLIVNDLLDDGYSTRTLKSIFVKYWEKIKLN